MPLLRLILLTLVAACIAAGGVSQGQEVPEPGTRWVFVYGWVQIGEKLVDAEQWPLALGSFIEAEAQLKQLKADVPDFEPEMVAYRLDWLETEIAAIQGKLGGGDHGIMMKYLDFIESFEQGQSERFNNELKKAYDTLTIAKVLLDEIIAERQVEFEVAMETQYDMLLDSLIWLDSQLNFKASFSRKPVVVDTTEWGTTRFVKQSDLPAAEGSIEMSGSLFLSAQVESAVAPFKDELNNDELPPEPEEGAEEPPLPTFRMSSKPDSDSEGEESAQ